MTTRALDVYQNNLKNREFGKEVPQNFDSERVTIAERQGASENRNFVVKPTTPKNDYSGCFGINQFSISIPQRYQYAPQSIPFAPQSLSESPAPLRGRAQIFLESLGAVDHRSFEAFLEMLLKADTSDPLPPFTCGATSTEDTIANISYFIRTLMPEAVPTEAIGITTGENIFQGMWVAIRSAAHFKRAQEMGDQGGMFLQATDGARGACQSLGGAAYIGYRGTMIAADIHNVDTSAYATTTLGKSAFAIGTIGNIFFTFFYLLIAIWSGYALVEDVKFERAMKAHEASSSGLFEFLMQKVQADPKAKLQKLTRYWNTLAPEQQLKQLREFKNELSKVALDALAVQFLSMQQVALAAGHLEGKKVLSKTEAKEVLALLLEAKSDSLREGSAYAHYLQSLGLTETDVADFDFSLLELIGFKLQEDKRTCKKEAKFSRATDGSCVEAVKKAAKRGLSERLKAHDALVKESAEAELYALKGRVKEENEVNQWMHSALFTYAVIGIVASLLGFAVVLPPAGSIALIVLTMLLCSGMLVTDGYFMVQGWNRGAPGRYDKPYLIAISIVIAAAIAVSVGVTLSFGLPLMPMILACAIGGTGLCLSGLAYYKISRKEKKWLEDHPDLMRFLDALESAEFTSDDALDDRVEALFRKLPKEERRAIRDKYFALCTKGEMGFHAETYRRYDQYYDFGAVYLSSQLEAGFGTNSREYNHVVSALRRCVKLYWRKWQIAKNQESLQIALQMQALFERALKKDSEGMKQMLPTLNQEAYRDFKRSLWYVVKRSESKLDLKRAIHSVIADSQQPLLHPSLPERVIDVFQSKACYN